MAVVELTLTGEPADAPPGTVAAGSGRNVRVACADAWVTSSLARIDGTTVEPAEALEPGVRLGDG